MAPETRARSSRQAEDLQVELPMQQLQDQEELALFKADLQRRNRQPEAARRCLQHLLRLHPNDLQVLQLLVLLEQEQGRQRQVTAELTVRFKGLEPGQRLEIGLLLADLLRQSGSDQTAMRLYGQLATENKTDARPLLALALLR